jgi:hypothetical protein
VIARRTSVVVALALATPVLAGCGMEAKDETSKEYSQVQAASNHIGAIKIRNAFITTLPGGGTGPAGPHTYLVVTLVNNSHTADALTGISTSGGAITPHAGADTTIGTSGVPLPSGVVVQISNPEINPDAPTLELTGSAPVVGTTQLVTFSFANAGTTKPIAVPVVSSGGSLSPTQVVPTDQATFSIPIE